MKIPPCTVAARPIPPGRTNLAGTCVNSVIRRVFAATIVVWNESDPAADHQCAYPADPTSVFGGREHPDDGHPNLPNSRVVTQRPNAVSVVSWCWPALPRWAGS